MRRLNQALKIWCLFIMSCVTRVHVTITKVVCGACDDNNSATHRYGHLLSLMCQPEEHSGQTTGHSREHARVLSTSGQFPSSSHKIPRSTSATWAISVLSSNIVPLQTFFSRVLLLRQQPSASRETNDNYRDKNTSLHVSLRTRKFDKKIHYCCRNSFFVEKDI